MSSTPEDAMAALVARLAAEVPQRVPGAVVIDGDPGDAAEDLTEAGQVAVFLGDRGAALDVNGAGPWWRETEARIEVLVQGRTAAIRRTRMRRLIDAVREAVDLDRTFGGVIEAVTLETVDPASLPVDGAAADAAWTFNAAEGALGPQGAQPVEEQFLVGLDGDAVAPIAGAHDVSHGWSLPLCARQSGLWLKGLMGDAASAAAVGSRGGFLFVAQPAAGDTITVGATTLEFVSGTPGAGEIEIGGDLSATVTNAAAAVDGEAAISASARGQLLWIEHDTADGTGDTLATTAAAGSRIRPLAATLAGGGQSRHVWTSHANTSRPYATVEVRHTDVSGAFRHRLVDSMMVRSLGFRKARSGGAMVSADVLARFAAFSAERGLNASPTELAAARFSYAAGSLFLDDSCVGVIEEASLGLSVDLEPGAMNACSVDPEGVIGEPAIGETRAALSVTARFPTSVLSAAADAGSTVSAELCFLSGATGHALFLEVPRVILDRRPSLSMQGRGQVLAQFAGRGLLDAGQGWKYRATLYSPVAGWPAP